MMPMHPGVVVDRTDVARATPNRPRVSRCSTNPAGSSAQLPRASFTTTSRSWSRRSRACTPNERPAGAWRTSVRSMTPEERAALVEDNCERLLRVDARRPTCGSTRRRRRRSGSRAWWRDDPRRRSRNSRRTVSLAKYRYVATPGIDKTGLNQLLADDHAARLFRNPGRSRRGRPAPLRDAQTDESGRS